MRSSLFRGLINFAIGTGAFALTCIGLHAVLPFPEIDQVSQKLRFFAAHKDEFDTVFIGSSRIYHHISPAIFDGVTTEKGHPTHSFNFGVDGMHLSEAVYLLEQVLNTKPANLKWIFIELDELQATSQGIGSRRAWYWHDWKRTSLVLRSILDAGTRQLWLPDPIKIIHVMFHRGSRELVAFHVSEFEKRFTNLGRANDIQDYFWRDPKTEGALTGLGPAGDGYQPSNKKKVAGAEYQETLARALQDVRARPVSPYTETACREASDKIRRLGAVPIFVVPPVATVQFEFTFRSNPPGTVMSFNNASLYPNLYQTDARIDRSHLKKEAAEEFTRLVAVKFARLLSAEEIK
ncbi:MAG: hypothetical protein QOI04_105 [Verrucomicrobiota bacterium]|jgi:hypothetical protein